MKEGTFLHKRDKSANQSVEPTKKRNKYIRQKVQKENNSTLETMVRNEKYRPYNSIHEMEREYLQEMDKMISCEGKTYNL